MSNSIQNVITKNLFLSFEKISHSNNNNKYSFTDLTETLTTALEKEQMLINNHTKMIQNKLKKIKKNDQRESSLNTNISLRMLKSNLSQLEDEMQCLSEEISLDSNRTDCEESKSQNRNKIHITPIDRSSLVLILHDYFEEINTQSESEFCLKLFMGEYFYVQNEEKTIKLVKNHYMRRRVCYKLFIVFQKLVSL